MRIVILTSESLPSNLITAAMVREFPKDIGAIVVSIPPASRLSRVRAMWRRIRRYGLNFAHRRRAIAVRVLWQRRRKQPSSNLPPDLRDLATQAAVPLIGIRNINSPATVEALRALQPDLLVSIYFSRRIKRAALEVPRVGTINVHPALLPKHRGPTPSFWTIANGEDRTGVTVHWIDEGLDTGDIIVQRELMLPPNASVSQVAGMVARPGAKALIEAVRLIKEGRAPSTPQDSRAASYESSPSRRDFRELRRRGRRYGSALDLVTACEHEE